VGSGHGRFFENSCIRRVGFWGHLPWLSSRCLQLAVKSFSREGFTLIPNLFAIVKRSLILVVLSLVDMAWWAGCW